MFCGYRVGGMGGSNGPSDDVSLCFAPWWLFWRSRGFKCVMFRSRASTVEPYCCVNSYFVYGYSLK